MAQATICGEPTAKGTPCRKAVMHGRATCKQHSDDADIGRRTLLTDDLDEEICRQLAVGMFAKDVCALVGISEHSFYHWIERGEADQEAGRETVFAHFAESSTRARAEAKRGALEEIRRAMPEDWRAAAWYLERSEPETWGRQTRDVRLEGRLQTEISFADLVRIAEQADAG